MYSYNGFSVADNFGSTLEAMRYLGHYSRGDQVTDKIYLYDAQPVTKEYIEAICSNYYVAYENQDVLAHYAKQIQDQSGTLEKLNDDHLVGHVDVAQAGRLFFTFPYDEGWTLTIDGQEVPLEMDAGLFMSAPISQGEHSYEMKFFPKGMRTGIAISAIGVVLFVALMVIDARWRKKAARAALPETQNASEGDEAV